MPNFSFQFCQNLMNAFGDIVRNTREDKSVDDGWTKGTKMGEKQGK